MPQDMKLVDLRIELKKRGLSPSGLKQMLVKRLEEALKADNATTIAERESDHSGGDDVAKAKKRKSPKKRHDAGKLTEVAIPPLSGTTFSKRVKLSRDSKGNNNNNNNINDSGLESVEKFIFEGCCFTFLHHFWRGASQVHKFEIRGGTFSMKQLEDKNENNCCCAGESDKEKKEKEKTEMEAEKQGCHCVDTNDDSASAIAIHRNNSYKEKALQKVILNWPSPFQSPVLQQWKFNQTYSHLLLSSAPCNTQNLGSSSQWVCSCSARQHPSNETGSRLVLISKHMAAFMQE